MKVTTGGKPRKQMTKDEQIDDLKKLSRFFELENRKLREQVKNLTIPVVMPRYFIDERAGCAAVRDREHPKYDKAYQGLHQDTPDVVVYAHGFQNHKKGCWEMKDTDINYIKLECDRLNRLNGANIWSKLTDSNKPENGIEVIGYNENWVHLDFNPRGTRICWHDDLMGWVSAYYNSNQDSYFTRCSNEDDLSFEDSKAENQIPTHFVDIPVKDFA